MKPTLCKEEFNASDRMLHQPHLEKIESLTRKFTLDACCNDEGDNALCEKYCSPSKSFLDHDCSGEHVWMNPPYKKKLFIDMLHHYLHVKHRSPETTSACIAVPEFLVQKCGVLLKGMILIHTFEQGQRVWTCKDRMGHRKLMDPPSWRTHVYYDPPRPSGLVEMQNHTPEVEEMVPQSDEPLFVVSCTINGLDGDMKLGGTLPDLEAVLGLDSMASRNFVDHGFIKPLLDKGKVKLKPHPRGTTSSVQVGGDMTITSKGVVRLQVECQGYKDHLWFEVLDLPKQFNILLGQNWMAEYDCLLRAKDRMCELVKKGKRHTLKLGIKIEERKSECQQGDNSPMIVSALQMKRILRKPKQLDIERSFMLLVQHVEAKPDILDNVKDKDVKELILGYQQITKDVPGVIHREDDVELDIQTEKDAKTPTGYISRLTPKERKVLEETIAELLEKGLIEPSKSPFGAPILFVGKKDGSLRMCVDYRGLNRITIKNKYPLPRVDDLLDMLAGANYFSSLDLQSGYHQIRVAEDSVHKTAFRTPLGHFQWKVMPFGLCNAPAVFQMNMNQIFGWRIGKYVVVYMDDILVFSKTREEHLEHLKDVLEVLKENKYHIKLKKCDFMKEEVKFLGHVVGKSGISVDPDKIEVIKKWQRPKDKSEIRSLLGFGNYFRRFIYRYSEMVLPLTEMTQVKNPPIWDDKAEKAFQDLKNAIIHAPVLKHPELDKPFKVVCDASNFASGAILMQDGHPISFASKKFSKAEKNYTTTERELLAIIHALKLYRCYLEGTHFTVCTDHNPLKYFDNKKDLSPREARWAQYLQRFDYEWEWIKGTTNPADFLSRNPAFQAMLMVVTRSKTGSLPKPLNRYVPEPRPKRNKERKHPVFDGDKQVYPKVVNGEMRPGTTKRKSQRKKKYHPDFQADPIEVIKREHLRLKELEKEDAVAQGEDVQMSESLEGEYEDDPKYWDSDVTYEPQEANSVTIDNIKAGYEKDKWFKKEENTKDLKKKNGLWYFGNAIVLPDFMNMRRDVFYECHNSPYSGHFGLTKTLQNIKRSYWWPKMRERIKRWIQICDSCQKNKPYQLKTQGLLQPLKIPERPWQSVSMDLITDLPKTPRGHDAIITVVDRLTKMAHFIPCTTTVKASELAVFFRREIVRLHGTPQSIVSDRDPRFTSRFWKSLCESLKTRQNMSTPYRPQTDGQTERMNRILEEVLRHYVAPHHGDWDSHIDMCEFAINNAVNESTGYSPFYLNYGYHPLTPVSMLEPSSVPAADQLHKQMVKNIETAKKHLMAAQKRQKFYYDQGKRHVHFDEDDWVLLSTKDIPLKHVGTPKLLPRFIGPFKVEKKIGENAYRLDLPAPMRIHNVFHVSKLRKYHYDGRVQPPPIPVNINGELEYEVEKVLGHRDVKRGKKSLREYLVRWKGYDIEYDEYVPEENFNSKEPIRKYWASR